MKEGKVGKGLREIGRRRESDFDFLFLKKFYESNRPNPGFPGIIESYENKDSGSGPGTLGTRF